MILGIDASQANRQIRSGTEWYAFYLISEFKKLLRGRRDVEVRLYFREQPREDLLQNWPENWKARILKWPVKYFWGQIRLSWEMLTNPPDVLFCPAHTIPLVHPRQTFTTLHDIGFVDNPELYDKLSLWYHRFSARLAVRSAAHIFTISEFSRKRIIEHYHCPPEKISVTHLGLPPLHLPLRKVEKERGYILFIGRLEPKKNILGMVRAFEAAGTGLDLVLAGRKVRTQDVDDYLAARSRLRDKVKFLGYIEEEEKRALLQGAAIFLFPTLYEGFGLPILEAQAAGVPVITSNTTANAEITTSPAFGTLPKAGEGGGEVEPSAILVSPTNIDEITAAIKELLTDEKLRNQKVKLGFENVKRFSWEKTAKETLATLLTSR